MPLPSSFLAHLRAGPYHPRSDKHSNALAEAVVTDLIATCSPLAEGAAAGTVVWDTNFDLVYGTATWNTDLAIGDPPPGTTPPQTGGIRKTAPSSVQIAIEIKGVMTEHRKAIKNRKRDLESHHTHVHNYNPNTIAGGMLVLNIADRFRSPLRKEGDITAHKDPKRLLEHCMNEARAISVRGGPTGDGLDAKCVIVVDDDNIDVAATEYHEGSPAPSVGDPMHWDAFIQRLCAEWTERFAA
jgi:hypothetical protein